MSHEPASSDYIDALFGAIRDFSEDLRRSRQWLERAGVTANQTWRLSFLRETRASYERAHAHLGAVERQLSSLAGGGNVPPPLDRLGANLETMRTDLGDHETNLLRAEAEVARASAPLGQA